MFMKGAVKIAPVYYVSGNHEAWSGRYSQIKQRLDGVGVYIMDDTVLDLSMGAAQYNFSAWLTLVFIHQILDGTDTSNLEEQLEQWSDSEKFKLLLTHRLNYLICIVNIR